MEGEGRPATAAEELSERRARTLGGILMAAMHIVGQEGTAGLSMSALAARAGVSRQTLYNYYPDVDAVLSGMVELGDAGTAGLAAQLADEPDARAALTLFVASAVESVRSGHPSLSALTAALPAELRTTMQAHEDRAEGIVVDLLRRGMAEGVFRADLDPDLDGRILHRAAFAGAELARHEDVDPERLGERLSTDLLRVVESGAGRRTRR
ncbi:MAG: TetR/AcrR family transcriptional regulator [Candidatus Limnocylindrales bacterium]